MMKSKVLFLAAVCTVAASQAAPVQTALLSVATEAATLDLARPASQRPTAPQKPLPHSEEFILKLHDLAQFQALEENRQVKEENARNLEIAIAADRETQARRENTARHVFQGDDFGRAILKTPEFFSDAIARGSNVVAVPSDADGFVDAPDGACLVRLLFSVPTFSPAPSPIPNASNEPVVATLHVMQKIESPSGQTLLFTEFDATRRFPNDALLGPARETSLEMLVRDAVLTSIAKIVETSPTK